LIDFHHAGFYVGQQIIAGDIFFLSMIELSMKKSEQAELR
jgi:hypothetical protein